MSSSQPHQLVLEWPYTEPVSVIVAGTFDQWKGTVHLNKSATGFNASLLVPWSEKVKYKFIVDGEWKVHEGQPTEIDPGGYINNVYIAPSKPISAVVDTPAAPDVTPTEVADVPPRQPECTPDAGVPEHVVLDAQPDAPRPVVTAATSVPLPQTESDISAETVRTSVAVQASPPDAPIIAPLDGPAIEPVTVQELEPPVEQTVVSPDAECSTHVPLTLATADAPVDGSQTAELEQPKSAAEDTVTSPTLPAAMVMPTPELCLSTDAPAASAESGGSSELGPVTPTTPTLPIAVIPTTPTKKQFPHDPDSPRSSLNISSASTKQGKTRKKRDSLLGKIKAVFHHHHHHHHHDKHT